jgi:hypothetical protein
MSSLYYPYMFAKKYCVCLATIVFLISIAVFRLGSVPLVAANGYDPVNLSRSGAATEPVILQEGDGTLHVIWQDRFAGFVYSNGQGANWSEPIAVTFPFSNPPFSTPASDGFNALLTPRLLLDEAELVHAFWQMDGALFYSTTSLAELADTASWSAPQSLAASAPAYAAAVAAGGRIHLAYIRTVGTEEFPAGVYYRQRTNDGWSNARQLYQSNYLRAARTDQLHVDIAVIADDHIFVTWDNYLADAVYYVRSRDAGSNWPDPVAFDQRAEGDNFDAPGPHYLQVVAHENNVHLFWNRYTSTGRCELSHRLAADSGSDWQPRRVLFEGASCPPRRHGLVDGMTGMLHLFTEQEQGSGAVRTWLDTAWTPPQARSVLSGFTNSETFRPVTLACFRPVVVQHHLLVVGCGQGNVEDIWLVRDSLPDLAQFATEATERWQPPAPIVRLSNKQNAPIVLPGQDGFMHALWLEHNPTLTVDVWEVRYAYWDGTSWSRPAPIVAGEIDQITAVINSSDRLLLAWRDLSQGSIWLKQVDVAQATFPSQWSPAKEMVVNESAVSQPALLSIVENEVYLAYALTVNEGRGIYIRRSEDGGLNWSDPTLAFDATTDSWSMVDAPSLAQTGDGSLHLMWSRHDLLHGNRPLAYYYARSLDKGHTWSASATLVAEGNVQRGRVVANPYSNEIFRIWQDVNEEWGVFWYQHSDNAGRTWTPAALIPSLVDLSGNLATFVDPAGRSHIVHMATNEAGLVQLDSWLWESDGWQAGENAAFEFLSAGDGPVLGTAIGDNGTFLLVFVAMDRAEALQNLDSRLFYTIRPIDVPAAQPFITTDIEEPTPLAIPEIDESFSHQQEQPAAVPTIDFAVLESEPASRTQFGPLDTTTSTGRILAGVLPAGLIVIFGVFLGMFALRKRG